MNWFLDILVTILYYTILPLIARLFFHRKAFKRNTAIKLTVLNGVLIFLNYWLMFKLTIAVVNDALAGLITSPIPTPAPNIWGALIWSILAFFILYYKPKFKKLEVEEIKEDASLTTKIKANFKNFVNDFWEEPEEVIVEEEGKQEQVEFTEEVIIEEEKD